MTTLLVLTTGQTDVQLIIGDERREFDKGRCGELHDQLGKYPGAWQVKDAPLKRGRDRVSVFSEPPWVLCTPKLDAVLRWFGEDKPDTVLLLETCRRQIKSDPRFAGGVLERRLQTMGVRRVLRCAYLQGDERDLENRDVPADAIVRREVVNRIDRAVREALAGSEANRVVLATPGGIPEIKALVKEVVRLHAPKDAPKDAYPELLEVDDGARHDPPRPDRAISRLESDPIESYRARRHALDLIERGNLLGAWGAVRHLHDDENERRWTRVIEWLACFSSSLPMPEDCDLSVLTHRLMAVRAALRVELALRAEDIPRAVHGSVAFFEAAMWDHLGKHAARHPDGKRLFKLDPKHEDLVRRKESCQTTKAKEDRNRPFILQKTIDGTSWYWIDDTAICAIRIAKSYLELDGLTKLGQAVSSDIRELRNDVAHNEPTWELMKDARRRMTKASLWSEGGTFLTQPLVQDVLRELDERNPADLCADLISAVRSRLLEPPPG